MKKILTMMRRDPDNPARVLMEVTPGCEWVLAGEGRAHQKYDGLCVLIDEIGATFTRRLVKPHQKEPDNFVQTDWDPHTNNRFGWIPSAQSGYQKYIDEGLERPHYGWNTIIPWRPGTYELCGPKINHNTENLDGHWLLEHATACPDDEFLSFQPLTCEDILTRLIDRATTRNWEGVVWHHPDGRMAKIKARDFGIKRAGR